MKVEKFFLNSIHNSKNYRQNLTIKNRCQVSNSSSTLTSPVSLSGRSTGLNSFDKEEFQVVYAVIEILLCRTKLLQLDLPDKETGDVG